MKITKAQIRLLLRQQTQSGNQELLNFGHNAYICNCRVRSDKAFYLKSIPSMGLLRIIRRRRSGDRNIFRDVAGVFSSSLATSLFGFLAGILMSRLLGPEGQGIYISLLVVPGIFISISLLGSRQSAIYFIGRKIFSTHEVIAALSYIFLIGTITGTTICAIYFVLIQNPDYSLAMVALALLSIPMRLLMNYSGGIFLGNLMFPFSNMLRWLTAILNLAALIVTIWLLHLGIIGALIAMLIANSAVTLYALWVIGSRFGISFKFDLKAIKEISKLGIVYAISLFIIQLNYRIDILILGQLRDMKEVGLYSIGVSITEKLWMLPFAMGLVLTSRTANMDDLATVNAETGIMMRLAFIIVLLSCAVLFPLAPVLIPLVYGSKFAQSSLIVQNIIPGILLFIVARILAAGLSGAGKPWIILLIFIPALLVNIALNYLWIPAWGGIGAAWATNVSYSFGAIALLIAYCRIMKISAWEMIRFRRSDFSFIREMRKKRRERQKLDNSVDLEEKVSNE